MRHTRGLRASPAFVVYLGAIGLIPFRWLSPIATLYPHADWTDALVGVSAALWLVERLRARSPWEARRAWHAPLAIYLLLSVASAAQEVPGRGAGPENVVLMAELAVLAVLSADFAADSHRRTVIARVIVASALASVALGLIGLLLFYLRVPNGLTGDYGQQFVPSRLYVRIQAGFESPPLLASFCIFASGVAASDDAGLSRRLRVATQVSLGLLCAATLSRGLIGFVFALIVRRSRSLQGRSRWFVPATALAVSLGIIGALTIGALHIDLVKPSTISYVIPDPGNRREAFVSSLTTLGHHPLLGIGPGGLPGTVDGAAFRAHFTPLNVAATLGFPSLLVLAWMFWLLWRRRRRPTDVALWSALVGIGIDGLAQDIDHFRHVWVLVGLLGA